MKSFYASLTGIILLVVLSSCQGERRRWQKADPESVPPIEVTIHRYEQALASIDPARFPEGIMNLMGTYSIFLGNQPPDSSGVRQLRDYLADPFIQELFLKTNELYPDLTFLEKKLSKAFRYYKSYYPNNDLPEVYTYVSGLDAENRVMADPGSLLIALDMYLGSDFEPYRQLGLPRYQMERLTRDFIARDCIYSLLDLNRNQVFPGNTVLDRMIHEGKRLWFLDAMMPEEPDEIKIGYTKEQIEWCIANESNLWKFILDNQVLFSSEIQVMNKFFTDGPFTSGFPGSPSRLGAWIGWQIVRDYMDNQPQVRLQELLVETDSRKVLTRSEYKPRK
jgi:hypothetical protein